MCNRGTHTMNNKILKSVFSDRKLQNKLCKKLKLPELSTREINVKYIVYVIEYNIMMTVRHAYTHFSVTCKNNNFKKP